jgi:hypothetical protein
MKTNRRIINLLLLLFVISATGHYTNAGLEGDRNGKITITLGAASGATAAQRGLKPRIIQLTRDAAVNGFTVETVNNTLQFRAINVRHPDTGKPLEGKRDTELFCDLPIVKSLLFNKGNSHRTRVKCLLVMVTPRIIINE